LNAPDEEEDDDDVGVEVVRFEVECCLRIESNRMTRTARTHARSARPKGALPIGMVDGGGVGAVWVSQACGRKSID
jgi:hypothetical protein